MRVEILIKVAGGFPVRVSAEVGPSEEGLTVSGYAYTNKKGKPVPFIVAKLTAGEVELIEALLTDKYSDMLAEQGASFPRRLNFTVL